MECNKCGKLIPDALNYCPTCKIAEEQTQTLPENNQEVNSEIESLPKLINSNNENNKSLLKIIFILLILITGFALYFYFNNNYFISDSDNDNIKLRCDISEVDATNKDILNYYVIDMEFDNETLIKSSRIITLSFIKKEDYDTYKKTVNEAEFDDNNLTITTNEDYKEYFKTNKLSKYNNILTYFLDNGYKCNGKESKQVSIKTLYEEKNITSPIIYKDRVYYINNHYLYAVNLQGKDKIDLSINNAHSIIFIIKDYLYYKTSDSYYRISISNYKDIIKIGDRLELEKINYDYSLLTKARMKDHLDNKNNLLPIYYKDKLINIKNNDIYLDDEILYEGKSNTKILALNDEYLYFIQMLDEEKKIIKYNLENKFLEKEIILAFDYNEIYSYNQKGIILGSSKKEIYKIEYHDFGLRKLELPLNDKDLVNSYFSDLYYIENNIIFEELNKLNEKAYLSIYNEITKETKIYADYLDYQIGLDHLFLINKDGKIEKILY